MKRILFIAILILISCRPVFAQNAFSDYFVINSGNAAKEGVKIQNRTFTVATCDTTYGLDISKLSTVYASIQAKDEATFLVYYQTSLDTVWSPAKLQDSLKVYTSQNDTIKAINFSTLAVGCKKIRWILKVTNTFPVGSTTPTYTATWKASQ
jgi:hypothetical protein